MALTPYGLRKILQETIKGCFLTIHRFHLINFPEVWAHFVAVQSRGYEANENVSGDGALRNGPLFGNSLSAALEMRDAYRSFQLEAFCVASR